MVQCQSPEVVAEYWRKNIETAEYYDPNRECFVVLLLDTRSHIKGHHLVAIGTLDGVHTHARETYRAAVIGSAHSIVLMHHHPSGIPTPSDADIQVTRELAQAGKLLKIDLRDHVIIGRDSHYSLRVGGHF